jgi:hypothetical protein
VEKVKKKEINVNSLIRCGFKDLVPIVCCKTDEMIIGDLQQMTTHRPSGEGIIS